MNKMKHQVRKQIIEPTPSMKNIGIYLDPKLNGKYALKNGANQEILHLISDVVAVPNKIKVCS